MSLNRIIINKMPSLKTASGITVLAVYFLILVGGIVRTTGSGMGCPDWPKCFGSWVPPTDVAQLPRDYKDVYSSQRAAKNEKFAVYLEKLGLQNQASLIRTDESILEEADFNPVKTWTEYINRLIGAVIGLLIFITLLCSIRYFYSNRKLFFLSLATFILVGFQGWFGSIVVSTNLLEWTITVHMFLAIVIVCLLILIYHLSSVEIIEFTALRASSNKLKTLLIACMALTFIQIFLGTQVREMVDKVSMAFAGQNRDLWIDELGLPFLIHRSFSIIILLVHYMMYKAIRSYSAGHMNFEFWVGLLLVSILIEVVSGVGMAYFAIPAFLQPIHLLFGLLAFGLQYYLLLRVQAYDKKNIRSVV
jgi:heme a synthase